MHPGNSNIIHVRHRADKHGNGNIYLVANISLSSTRLAGLTTRLGGGYNYNKTIGSKIVRVRNSGHSLLGSLLRTGKVGMGLTNNWRGGPQVCP